MNNEIMYRTVRNGTHVSNKGYCTVPYIRRIQIII